MAVMKKEKWLSAVEQAKEVRIWVNAIAHDGTYVTISKEEARKIAKELDLDETPIDADIVGGILYVS